jgi:hypothetical protein
MEDLDDENRANEWDDYWPETLILGEVVIGAIAVFEGRAGWDRALACEEYVGYYHQLLRHREVRKALSSGLADGVTLDALVPTVMDAAQGWAELCQARHDASGRPWPPPVPGAPPPRPGAAQ